MEWLKKKVYAILNFVDTRTQFNNKHDPNLNPIWKEILKILEKFFQVQRTVSTLKKSNISVGGGVKSSTFVRVKQEDASEGKKKDE